MGIEERANNRFYIRVGRRHIGKASSREEAEAIEEAACAKVGKVPQRLLRPNGEKWVYHFPSHVERGWSPWKVTVEDTFIGWFKHKIQAVMARDHFLRSGAKPDNSDGWLPGD